MSVQKQIDEEFLAARPHRDAFHAATDDLAAAIRLSPDAVWQAANQNSTPSRLQPVLKRTLDLAVAVPMLILFAPVLAVLALIVLLDSGGPVFFRQTRLGLNGKAFDVFKFRTMRVMENGDNVVQATRNDSRVTRSGRWLRSTSLDELPQLLNIIAGDMSLVGPRPHARAHDVFYAAKIADYTQRQTVKPGVTGWAQVNGHRGETPTVDAMRERVDLDIWYARNTSVLLDLKILLRTPLAVLGRRNAY